MTKKGWIIFSVLCVAVFGGLIAISQGDKIDVSKVQLAEIHSASNDSGDIADHVFGNEKSKVILYEYGDYQCPGCESAYPIIKQVTEKYKDQLGFVFRNFPLTSIHPNALAAASVSEAAGLHGKYWEMHDKLYEDQAAWKDLTGTDRTEYFVAAAENMGIDGTSFRKDIDSTEVKKKIDFDRALGQKAGITGTPSFFINGKNVGDQYVLDGKVVPKGTEGASLIWSDATAFESLVIVPALKEQGIALPAAQ
jgi:protein-disulfide isomerase